jgi:hypothetical protein
MPEQTPTAGRSRRTIRRLTAGAVLVALVCATGCGDGSTASPSTGAASNSSATPGGKGQPPPANKRMPK